MFRPDLVGHLHGDFYNVCSVCFDLNSLYSSRPARPLVSLWTMKYETGRFEWHSCRRKLKPCSVYRTCSIVCRRSCLQTTWRNALCQMLWFHKLLTW